MKDKKFLDAIRNKLKKEEAEQKERGSNKSKTFGDMYPHWNIQEGADNGATIRVLPHKHMEDDATDPFVYKLEHVLSIGGNDKKIPCLKMYDEECPICALSAKYYADKNEEKGSYFWRKKKALASIYVVKDPLPASEDSDENAEGKMKLAQLGNQLATRYSSRWKALLNSGDMDDLPWDLKDGVNFNIVKVMKGKYPNYEVDSDFVRKSSSLPEDFLETFEPVDLTQYLPKNPGLDKVKRMLDAHLTGEDYVEEDGENDSNDDASDTPPQKPAPKVTSKDAVQEALAAKKTTSTKKVVEPEPEESKEPDSEDDGDSSEADDDFLERLKRRAAAK